MFTAPEKLKTLLDKKEVKLIDVREDYESGSRTGRAIHIPFVSLRNNLRKLDREQACVVYCRTGPMS